MKIINKNINKLLVGCTVLMPVLMACAANNKASIKDIASVSSDMYEGFKTAIVDDLVVFPVLVRTAEGGVLIDPEKVLGIPDENYTGMLYDSLDIQTNLQLEMLSKEYFQKQIPLNGLTKEVLFKKVVEAAKELNASNIAFAIVDSKDMRTGGTMGSDRSSSIGYRIWLYNLKADKVIWSSAYQSNQSALSDNLFEVGERLEEGLAFKTSEQLLRSAFKSSAIKLNKELNKIHK